jgi:dienelactone hydrolase
VRPAIHKWVRRFFLVWATVVMLWLANSVRTQGVDRQTLQDSAAAEVSDAGVALVFEPRRPAGKAALIFVCGSGIAPQAYAPLLRPVADSGYPVVIIRLPYRFAPLAAHKDEVLARIRAVIESRSGARWAVSGHSLGAALAARFAAANPERVAALVLVGTTHPKEADLSSLPMPVTKVFASRDGVARPADVIANRPLLPASARFIEIEGGNHSHFGHYGWQIFDGRAAIPRERQQEITRAALIDALRQIGG